MGVLKSIKRKSLSSRKLLNYSAVSNDYSNESDNNNVQQEESPATTALFPHEGTQPKAPVPILVAQEDTPTPPVPMATEAPQAKDPEAKAPIYSSSLLEENKTTPAKQKKHPEDIQFSDAAVAAPVSPMSQRMPVEPIAPLGVVTNKVDPDEWDVPDVWNEAAWEALSHISGISAGSDPSTTKPSEEPKQDETTQEVREEAPAGAEPAMEASAKAAEPPAEKASPAPPAEKAPQTPPAIKSVASNTSSTSANNTSSNSNHSEEFAKLRAMFNRGMIATSNNNTTSTAPTVVPPSPEDKECAGQNDSRDESSMLRDEDGFVKTNVVVEELNTSSDSSRAQHVGRIARIVKKGGSLKSAVTIPDTESTSSHPPHVFEDNSSTGAGEVATAATANTAASIYSEELPMPTTVSPEHSRVEDVRNSSSCTGPSFETIMDDDNDTAQTCYVMQENPKPKTPSSPMASGTPSFDGSTATAHTNNTTHRVGGSTLGGSTVASGSTAGSAFRPGSRAQKRQEKAEFTDKFSKTLNEVQFKMLGSCHGMDFSQETSRVGPMCDSFLSSTSALSANLKDSLKHISRELSSGIASVGQAAGKKMESLRCPSATNLSESPSFVLAKKRAEDAILSVGVKESDTTQELSFVSEGDASNSSSGEGSVTSEQQRKLDEEQYEKDKIYFTRTATQASI